MTAPRPAAALPPLSRCRACSGVSFPAKRFCPHCGDRALAEEPLAREGEVYSCTAVPEPGGRLRRLALVHAGGVRVLVPVPDAAPELAVGMRVRLRARDEPPGYELDATDGAVTRTPTGSRSAG